MKLLKLIYYRKYTGYEGLASFMGSDQDFMVIRRFDKLHARILLYLQAFISQREQDLRILEHRYKNAPYDIDNGTVLNDQPERMELIREIADLLNKYDIMMLQYSMLASHPNAPKRNIKNLRNWFDNNRQAISDEEAGFINRDDIICMSSTEQSAARQIFDECILKYTKGIFRCFAKKREEMHISTMDSKHTFISDDTKTDKLATTALFLVGLSVIVVPLWVLWLLQTTRAKLIAISIFILIFLVFLLTCTVARPLQVLAATAA
jgi:hypothetical protein